MEGANLISEWSLFHVLTPGKANEFWPKPVLIRGITRSHFVFRKTRLWTSDDREKIWHRLSGASPFGDLYTMVMFPYGQAYQLRAILIFATMEQPMNQKGCPWQSMQLRSAIFARNSVKYRHRIPILSNNSCGGTRRYLNTCSLTSLLVQIVWHISKAQGLVRISFDGTLPGFSISNFRQSWHQDI